MSSVLYLLIIVAFGLSVWAQFKVKGTFNKWSESPAFSGMTGAEVARRILDANGLHDVPVEPVPGKLTDHYDPVARAVRLSESVRSEEHTSELQSRENLVCRLLLEKKNIRYT